MMVNIKPIKYRVEVTLLLKWSYNSMSMLKIILKKKRWTI